MITIDSNEPKEMDGMLGQYVECDRRRINQQPNQTTRVFPDYVLNHPNAESIYGVSRKSVTEVLGGLDQVEEQMVRELSGPVDYLVLLVEGFISFDDRSCIAWTYDRNRVQIDGNDNVSMYMTGKSFPLEPEEAMDASGFIRGRRFQQNYKGLMAWYHRLWQLGIPVINTADKFGTVSFLAGMYDSVGKSEDEHQTFKRLIKANYYLDERNQEHRDFALSLMGIRGANIGQEVGLSLAPHFSTLGELIQYMAPPEWMGGGGNISEFMIREKDGVRPRKIGPAAEQKLRRAIGL